jgi:hypothetical protein
VPAPQVPIARGQTSIAEVVDGWIAHPLTEPATMPRMKKRCRDRKTISGTIIVKKPPAVISCQP